MRLIFFFWLKISEAYWVHVWSVEDGRITQLLVYFDTWLTAPFRVSEPWW